MDKYNFKEFKGIYWDYDSLKDEWILSDSTDITTSNLAHFNASIYGIHEAFEAFKEFLKEKKSYQNTLSWARESYSEAKKIDVPLIKLKIDTNGKTISNRKTGSKIKKSKYKGTGIKNKKFK